MTRHLLSLVAITMLLSTVQADVFSYVAAPDPSYAWTPGPTGPGYATINLTSQTWQGIPWRHTVTIYRPEKLKADDVCVLVITGGNFNAGPESALYSMLAGRVGLPVAVLWNIPNQPLFDGKREDALIAYSLVKTVETKDETWPLLFPMTKAAVKAMDAVQDYAAKNWPKKITRFITTGASKRGWTTWFTGAVDARVCAIMPMVYDNLNIPQQMQHQIATWGSYSPQIKDYTENHLQEMLTSEHGRHLAEMIDPFTYRDKITMPKLILSGTNDAYWTVDALNFYRGDLKGETYNLYVPNSGHGLGDMGRVFNTVNAFATLVATGQPRPKLDWKYEVAGTTVTLRVTAPDATKVVMWSTAAEAGKFVEVKWEARDLTKAGDAWVGSAEVPAGKQLAAFGEATFGAEGASYTLSTGMKLTPEK